MRKIVRRSTFAALIVLLVSSTCFTSLAEMWQPYEFKGDERFEYKVIWKEGGEQEKATYILDIKESGQQTEDGEKVFEVSYTTKGRVPQSQLGAETAYGFWGTYGISLHTVMLNPAYGLFFSQLELKVEEKMNFYEAGMVKVVKKEKVAGRDGFVCRLFETSSEEKLLVEWTIDPRLALPLRSRVFNGNELESQVILTSYTRY